jgi:stage III sporulation protein SpoIIIAA
MIINTDLAKLTQVFPDYIERSLKNYTNKSTLIEIVMDLGRRPEARFLSGAEYLSQQLVSWQDLDYVSKRLGHFSQKNRAGIERTLHRVSCIRNRQGIVIGLTCRVGRCVLGGIGMIRDLLDSEESLLILGKPGLGKTTLIREISRVLSDEVQKRVVIVDTSNEIAGNSDIPHVGIGQARRMQASSLVNQHSTMIEAIENHMPEAIVVDEIGTELEALAARTIAERGVKLIGTAHGNTLENLIKNPTLSDLLGGIQSVTLSDEEARRRGSQKTIIERKALPAFPMAIELNEKKAWTIHEKVEASVDAILKRQAPCLQKRSIKTKKLIQIVHTSLTKPSHSFFFEALPFPKAVRKNPLIVNKSFSSKKTKLNLLKQKKADALPQKKKGIEKQHTKKIHVYSFGLSNKNLEKALHSLGTTLVTTKLFEKADILVINKLGLEKNSGLQKRAKEKKIPVYLVQRNSFTQYNLLCQHLLKCVDKDSKNKFKLKNN